MSTESPLDEETAERNLRLLGQKSKLYRLALGIADGLSRQELSTSLGVTPETVGVSFSRLCARIGLPKIDPKERRAIVVRLIQRITAPPRGLTQQKIDLLERLAETFAGSPAARLLLEIAREDLPALEKARNALR